MNEVSEKIGFILIIIFILGIWIDYFRKSKEKQYPNYFEAKDKNRCYKCNTLLGNVEPFRGMIRISDFDLNRNQCCYKCNICGRVTCYDCCDNTLSCVCGHKEWVDAICHP